MNIGKVLERIDSLYRTPFFKIKICQFIKQIETVVIREGKIYPIEWIVLILAGFLLVQGGISYHHKNIVFEIFLLSVGLFTFLFIGLYLGTHIRIKFLRRKTNGEIWNC